MTWFKVDDGFHSHPKVYETDADALGLWVVAGSWCSANLTDGRVPDQALFRLMPDAEKLARKLVDSGLWGRVKGGYQFHDWGDFNPRADDVKAEREQARDRMRALRSKRRANQVYAAQGADCSPEQTPNVREELGEQGPNVRNRASGDDRPSDPETMGGKSHNGSSEPELFGRTGGERSGFVRNPDPTRPEGSNEPSSGARKRGTRIPDDFDVTPAMIEWARKNTPDVGKLETEMFIDHFRAASGSKGVKLDWVGTWRNWMRTEQKRANERKARDARLGTPRQLPPSNAPAKLSDDERCQKHPTFNAATCGLCRAARIGDKQ